MKKIFILFFLVLVFILVPSCSLMQILFSDASGSGYKNFQSTYITNYGSYYLNTSGGNVAYSVAYGNKVYVSVIDSSGKLQIYILTENNVESPDEERIEVDPLELYDPVSTYYDPFIYDTGMDHSSFCSAEGFKPIIKVTNNTLYLYTLKMQSGIVSLDKVEYTMNYDISSTAKGYYCIQNSVISLSNFTSNDGNQNFILYDLNGKIACTEPGSDIYSFALLLYDLKNNNSIYITLPLPGNFINSNINFLNSSCCEDDAGNIYVALVSYNNVKYSYYLMIYKVNIVDSTYTILYNSYDDSLKVPSEYLFPEIFFYKKSSSNQGPYFCWNYLDPDTNKSIFAISKITNNERIDIYKKTYNSDNYIHYINVRQESFQGILTSRILITYDIYNSTAMSDICYAGFFEMNDFSFKEVVNSSASASENIYDIPEIVDCDSFSFVDVHYYSTNIVHYYYYKFGY